MFSKQSLNLLISMRSNQSDFLIFLDGLFPQVLQFFPLKYTILNPFCSFHLDFSKSSHSTECSALLGIAGNIDCILLRNSFIL